MMCCMLGLELGVHAQESVFLQQYREKVKAYFLPSLSGNANASYTGNPLELYRELPSIETPLYFQGRDTKYGASVTLLQPVYSGGALKSGLEKSRKEKESALYEEKRVTNDVLYQADQYYWNKVAKAATSEQLAMDKYKEGTISIVEVLNAQMYHQEAELNHIRSKLRAQLAKSSLERAAGRLGEY